MNEHPLALENGNADSDRLKKKKSRWKYSAYILYGITGVSSGLLWNEMMISVQLCV